MADSASSQPSAVSQPGAAVGDTLLVCRVGRLVCALPLAQVRETMRPQPVEPLAGAPRWVRGLALIRGAPVAVLDAGLLLRGEEVVATRLVTLDCAGRTVALAVGSVVGLRHIAPSALQRLPPLLREAGGETVAVVAALDAELLLLLRAGRLVPEELWPVLAGASRPEPAS